MNDRATVICDVCGNAVPAGSFCGACGSRFVSSSGSIGTATRRGREAYAADPDEPVLLVAIVSTLFPTCPIAAFCRSGSRF